MIKRLFNSESKTITGAAIVISGATLLSRLVGIIRDRTFTHYFGAGPVTDAYFAAFKIPDLIYNLLIVGALTAGFIPTFTKLFYKNEDKTEAWKLANNIINIIAVSLVILAGLGIAFTTPLAQVIAPGFSGERLELVITFTRIMFLSPLILGISMVMGGILQSLRHFLLYSIAPVFYNIGIIIGAAFLSRSTLGISGLAWGVVLGALLHAGIQVYGAYQNGYRWQWYMDLKDTNLRLIGKLMVPRTLGLAITQLNTVVVTILASLLPVGSVTVYNLANNLQGVPTGLIGIPFALAVFPLLSTTVIDNNEEGFIKHLTDTTRQIIFLIVPLSICFLLLRAQIVRVVLGSGQFSWTDTIHTADALAFFALGLFAQSLIPLYARAFYALSNTKTPFTMGVISELIAIITALVLMKPLGVAGLALASSIGATLNLILLFISLRQITGGLEEDRLFKLIYKVAIAALAMGLTVQYLKYPLAAIFNQNYFWGILGQGFFAGLVGLAVYFAVCYSLRLPEVTELITTFERRWLRFRRLPTEEGIEIKE